MVLQAAGYSGPKMSTIIFNVTVSQIDVPWKFTLAGIYITCARRPHVVSYC